MSAMKGNGLREDMAQLSQGRSPASALAGQFASCGAGLRRTSLFIAFPMGKVDLTKNACIFRQRRMRSPCVPLRASAGIEALNAAAGECGQGASYRASAGIKARNAAAGDLIRPFGAPFPWGKAFGGVGGALAVYRGRGASAEAESALAGRSVGGIRRALGERPCGEFAMRVL